MCCWSIIRDPGRAWDPSHAQDLGLDRDPGLLQDPGMTQDPGGAQGSEWAWELSRALDPCWAGDSRLLEDSNPLAMGIHVLVYFGTFLISGTNEILDQSVQCV